MKQERLLSRMKILNCPFCGSDSINMYHEQHEEESMMVHYSYCECTLCLMQGPLSVRRFGTEEGSKKGARQLWNLRLSSSLGPSTLIFEKAKKEVNSCNNCGDGKYLLKCEECPYCERKYGDV